MVVPVLVAFRNDDASVRDVADDVLELNRRMKYAEAFRQRVLHLAHDRF